MSLSPIELILTLFKTTFHHVTEVTEVEAGSHWFCHTKSESRDEWWYIAQLLLFIQSRTPAHWIMLPIFRVCPHTLII